MRFNSLYLIIALLITLIKAGAAGQFGIVLSEGTDNKEDLQGEIFFGVPASRTSALGIYSGVEANASFEVLAELRLSEGEGDKGGF